MPLRPGSPEWHARVAALRAEEWRQPEQWWYLSFATDTAFLGACVVRARGMMGAMQRAHALGINPGGEVMSFPVGDGPQPYPTDRLLSKAELGPGAKSVGELEQAGMLPGDHVRFD